MAKRVIFSADHDHTWPSQAVTACKKGWSGVVKDEVAESAIAAGKAELVGEPDDLPRNMPQLRGIAKARGIDLSGASTVDEILAAIRAAPAALPDDLKTE